MQTKKQQEQRKKPPEKPGARNSDDGIKWLLDKLRPMLEFHEPVDDAEDDDVRIYWDVRAVRGSDTVLARVTGSSTMSGILGQKVIGEASTLIASEVALKIAQPLAAKFQAMAEAETLSAMPELDAAEMKQVGLLPPPATAGEMARHLEDEE